jgi:hexosaminidase
MTRATVAVLAIAFAGAACATRASVTSGPPAMTSTFDVVIPRPRLVEPAGGGRFTVTAETVITVAPGDERASWVARYLADWIGLAAGAQPPRVLADGSVPANAIALVIDAAAAASPEGYELRVEAGGVTIRAREAAGLFYGVQTLRQLLPAFVEYDAIRPAKDRPVTAPAIRIVDAPRFAWRGAMLDVARHFFGVADVKRFIDLLVVYKINRLHLHLADDQGWRIEIKKWPELTRRGGASEVGGGAGGFYTQDEYAEIVGYAADRFVTIVPEIDMPGHTNAALASYAELNCDGIARQPYTGIEVGFSALCVDKEITYTFIDDVMRELAAMTPGPWLHIGGDEVKTLSSEQYVRFIERVQGIVGSHGKRMIGWDEISPARLEPTTLVQHWRPKETLANALAQGTRIIMSVASRAYLDMKYDAATPIGLQWAGLIDVRRAYDWDPATEVPGVPQGAIAGVEAPLWSETLATIDDVEYLAFPRLAAIAEVAWSPADTRDWEAFRRRLGTHGARLTALGVNFYRAPGIEWHW